MRKTIDLRTRLPGAQARKYLGLSKQYESGGMTNQIPIVWKKGLGIQVEDVDGNKFMDFTSGVLVANIGHCHPKYVEEIKKQAEELHHCYDFITPWRVELAKKLVEITPANLDRAFILTTGSEATEAAIRLARCYTGKQEIIAFHGGFHGRTYGAMSLAGKAGTKKGFGTGVPGTVFFPYPYCYRCLLGKKYPECRMACFEMFDRILERESSGNVGAMIIEPYQGGSGFVFPPKGFLKKVEKWCNARKILLILDEVQASFGRTGKMFAAEHEGLMPNLMCLGKGLGSGLATSALMGESKIFAVLKPGSMSSTHGGNPMSSRAALSAIRIIEDERLSDNARKTGKYLLERFKTMERKYKILGEARGMGLVMGLEMVKDKKTKEPAPLLAKKLSYGCYRRGLILGWLGFYGNVIRIAPPLVITQDQASEGADIIEKVLKELC